MQVRNVLPAADFVSHFNKQLAVFRDHHFKSVFLAQQRANVWKNCPSDWIIMSIDWNSNYERKQNTTLTCLRSRSAILCPIVLLRWIVPINDPSWVSTMQSLPSPRRRTYNPVTSCKSLRPTSSCQVPLTTRVLQQHHP